MRRCDRGSGSPGARHGDGVRSSVRDGRRGSDCGSGGRTGRRTDDDLVEGTTHVEGCKVQLVVDDAKRRDPQRRVKEFNKIVLTSIQDW